MFSTVNALRYGAFTSRYVPCATEPEYTPLRWSLLCNRKLNYYNGNLFINNLLLFRFSNVKNVRIYKTFQDGENGVE